MYGGISLCRRYLTCQAESNSKIVGFVLGAVITKKRLEKHGYIEWVAIHPDYQRLGVGTKLVSLLADKMLDEYGVGTLSADTSADNTPARNFLSKLGFCNQKAHVYMSCTTNHDTQVANRHNEDGGKSLIGAHDGSGVMIRPMGLDDLNAVFLLGERMFTKERFPNLYLGWDEYEVMDMFDTDSQSCLVAEYKDEMVGFVLGNTIEKSRATFTYGYLRWLGVSPDVQRLGVGRKLFAAFEELMNEENVHMLIIDTQADNLPAIRFFENMGFGSQSDHFYYSRPAARLGV
eukprot:TRINITY_DN2704_c0_g1_i2.p1 TRINITY_DN2704_c0_g1~~TRINITY_DN2704_c0_g1_i2.p1  ORF type:complete len:289 (-),score=50.68 TRINITY_DN2704_c0_g1_i2:84-950(-)